MEPADDRYRAMKFQRPEFIPVRVSLLPAVWMKYRDELRELASRHPLLFEQSARDKADFDAVTGCYAEGRHVDPWGYVWCNIAAGRDAYVCEHPLPRREMVNSFQAPPPGAGLPHGFMFLRLTYLRGYEEAMIDFAEEPPELQRLVDIVLDYNVGEMRQLLGSNPPPLVILGDDLGTQKALPISPAKWRKYLKPCFAKIFGLGRAAGSDVYLHTDGHIIPIIKDLIECGVTVLNPQIRANGLDRLVQECKGKVCVDLDLDRQFFPFASPQQIDDHVREAVEKLGSPDGGLWLVAEIGPEVPLTNIEAICRSLENYRGYYTSDAR